MTPAEQVRQPYLLGLFREHVLMNRRIRSQGGKGGAWLSYRFACDLLEVVLGRAAVGACQVSGWLAKVGLGGTPESF